MSFKTPNVYVREKAILPPSVAEVETAIPAFIGRTEITSNETDGSFLFKPMKITSHVELDSIFGGPAPESFTVDENGNKVGEDGDNAKLLPSHLLYQSILHFFANGGGACYLVSIGDYETTSDAAAFLDALEALKAIDEVTLLLFPDAVNLEPVQYYDIVVQALQQCADLQDRFVPFDVLDSGNPKLENDIIDMRDAIGTRNLKYGAAYYPYVRTSIARAYTEDNVTVLVPELDAFGIPTGNTTPTPMSDLVMTDIHASVKAGLAKNYLVLPPCASVVGIYAQTDETRGVWKAPANISINQVIGPIKGIDDDTQEDMNVDPVSGKSVNAIRAFAGQGTLVWGARTLAGNDNEWRYIPVRRLFNFVEESVKKASRFAVFEPNVPFTWLKVKSTIESFLQNVWEQGGLFGDSPEQAYFVNVGLGQTMTEDDINNGIMNIEIGLAAVRPAEFIILTFSHKSISN
ncbi:phage tail sheath family protein [Spartinivicinus poritis]|uniref:Phage tail sheath subtilisin-like domain-containing protein n=1 Tax=Spartinivicinus poritis TaxID=2994640 RepID=A0ABT5UF71_9GAMM|nr:phage tail sheath C-terminal domain-containing protein [Spartinivicinus sp. A2-2]MDE1465021.1 phage tail sheath subtilisin-like domain-containing protein [Spartinivicinus sp. A2-2]